MANGDWEKADDAASSLVAAAAAAAALVHAVHLPVTIGSRGHKHSFDKNNYLYYYHCYYCCHRYSNRLLLLSVCLLSFQDTFYSVVVVYNEYIMHTFNDTCTMEHGKWCVGEAFQSYYIKLQHIHPRDGSIFHRRLQLNYMFFFQILPHERNKFTNGDSPRMKSRWSTDDALKYNNYVVHIIS